MKILKFAQHLVPLVISGEKTSTWRLFDDKDLQEGDELSFINRNNNQEFAKAKIIKIEEKRLGDINDDDFENHEKFESKDAMFEAYRNYYGDKVSEDSVVKMVDFKILKITNQEDIVSCAIIYNPEAKKFLLQHRTSDAPSSPNQWSLFGGHVEKGETINEALLRELKEEMGVLFQEEDIEFLHKTQVRPEVIRNVFIIESNLDKSEIILGEGQGFDWVSSDKVLDYDLSDKTREDITKFLENHKIN